MKISSTFNVEDNGDLVLLKENALNKDPDVFV